MIKGYVFGGTETVAKIDRLKGVARSKVKQTVVALVLLLMIKVKGEKLSGQVLKVRTGRLRRSINYRIDEKSTSIFGVVGTTVKYGKTHELGFHGTVTVKEHLRTIKQAWGKPLREGPRKVLVRQFTKRVDFPERSFLRSSLKELEPKAKKDLLAALQTEFRGTL